MSRTRANILTACLIGLTCAIVSALPSMQRLEQELGLRWLFQLRGSRQPPADILLVTMNADSAARIFLPSDAARYQRCVDLRVGSAPKSHVALPELPARWPRCVHARLIDALKKAGARLVVFDVLFRPRMPGAGPDSDANAYQDHALAAAIADSGNVLIAEKLEASEGGSDSDLATLSAEIRDAALGSAPFPVIPSPSRRIDRFSVFHEDAMSRPSLPMVALQAADIRNYASLYGLLETAAPDAARFLPRTAEDVQHQRYLQSLTLYLRQLFREASTSTRAAIDAGRRASDGELAALLEAYSGDGIRWLNYFGPSGTLATMGYEQALAAGGESSSQHAPSVSGKFVFVGYLEHDRQEQMEHFPTPYSAQDRSDLSGLEILATAFANLMHRESLRPLPVTASMTVNFAAAALAAIAALTFGLWSGIGATVLLGGVWVFLATTIFAVGFRWMPVFTPLVISLPLGFATGFATRYLRARWERARLRQAIGALVPDEVADALEANLSDMRGFRRTFESVCVATDAAQFTRLAERMHTEALAELMNRYFGELLRPIAAHGGFVADIVGDAIVAVWRIDSQETRRKVCLALLEMAEAVERFNANARETQLPTRFGADLGQITLGSLGAPERYEYRAVGNTVNTASRLQELNKQLGTRILVNRKVTAGLGEFLVRDLGRFVLRGKSLPVDIVELVGLLSAANPRQVELCDRFAQAMQLVESGRSAEALANLQSISRDYPQDGATRYYVDALSSGHKGRADGLIAR